MGRRVCTRTPYNQLYRTDCSSTIRIHFFLISSLALQAATASSQLLVRAKAKAKHAINTISPYNRKFTGEVEQDAVSVMTLVVPLIRNKSHFRLQGDVDSVNLKGRPILMSATMREQAVIDCTMFSLQICFLLSEKSMRRNPPPGARIIFRGSTSPCAIRIL